LAIEGFSRSRCACHPCRFRDRRPWSFQIGTGLFVFPSGVMNTRDIRQGNFRRSPLADVRQHMGVENVLVVGSRRRLPLGADVLGHERFSHLGYRIGLPFFAPRLGRVVAAGDGPAEPRRVSSARRSARSGRTPWWRRARPPPPGSERRRS